MENRNKMSCILLSYILFGREVVMNNPGDDSCPETLNRWELEAKVGGFYKFDQMVVRRERI